MAEVHYPWETPEGADKARLKVLNSLTGTKTPFVPLNGGNLVKWYICGPTVYDSSHIGHASNYVRFDIVRRILSEYFGFDVVVQMNVTDIDDKIIMRANERGIPFEKISREFEREFLEDMAALNVRPADFVTRVSEYVPEIVEYIEKIIQNGFAYESDGSVYFDTQAFVDAGHNYGKMEPWSVGNGELLAEGEGKLTAGDETAKQSKKSANDFVLWKRSKPGEPKWESPWGEGRPGWHIECSAMAACVLGERIDIHAGGIDLRFPHHSNEIAQAEGYHCCQQWVNYFMHSGHLHIEGRKMSKSLKNFTTIRECLKRYNARQLRLLFLTHRYDAPMHYAEKSMTEAVSLDRSFIDFFGSLKAALREAMKQNADTVRQRPDDADFALQQELEVRQKAVHDALADNFDTQSAFTEIIQLVGSTNAYMSKSESVNATTLSSVGRYLSKMLRVFGVMGSESQQFTYGEGSADADQSREDTVGPVLDAFAAYRDSVRRMSRAESGELSKRLLELSDSVRDDVLPPLGVRLEDRGEDQSSKWILEDSESLMLEIRRKKAAEAEKAAEKRRLKAEREAKELLELEKGRTHPSEMFKLGDYATKYSAYAEDGMPTKDSNGEDLAKSALKTLKKARLQQEKIHARFLKAVDAGRIAADPSDATNGADEANGTNGTNGTRELPMA